MKNIILENYLIFLNEQSVWYKIRNFFASPIPKNTKRNTLIKLFKSQEIACTKIHPNSGTHANVQIGDFDLTYDDFKENPEQTNCIIKARYELMKAIYELYKSIGPEGMCSNNKYKEKCIKFATEEFEEVEVYYKQLKETVKSLNKMQNRLHLVTKNEFNKLKI